MFKDVVFFEKEDNKYPVQDFILSFKIKTQKKIFFVLKLIKDSSYISKKFLKKLKGSNEIWEIRVKTDEHLIRILRFIHNKKFIVLTNGLIKKSNKTPINEIKRAERYKSVFLQRSLKE